MPEGESLHRRELFKILGVSLVAHQAAAQHHERGASSTFDIASYRPRFLSSNQYQTIDRLCELIIPVDETGPGAHQAGVPFYIDSILHYAAAKEQQQWLRGLDEIDYAAVARFGRTFLECVPAQQEQLLAVLAANEDKPKTGVEEFFVAAKALTLEAYCFSEVAERQYFGYRGDTMLAEFPGCTHPEHQKP
jgi:hypothetical protein